MKKRPCAASQNVAIHVGVVLFLALNLYFYETILIGTLFGRKLTYRTAMTVT